MFTEREDISKLFERATKDDLEDDQRLEDIFRNEKEIMEAQEQSFRVSSWGHKIAGLKGGSDPIVTDCDAALDMEYSTIGDSFDEDISDPSEPAMGISESFPSLDVEFSTIGDSFEESDDVCVVSDDKEGAMESSEEASNVLVSKASCSNKITEVEDCFDVFDFHDDSDDINNFQPVLAKNSLTVCKKPDPCCDKVCNAKNLSPRVLEVIERMVINKSERKQKLLDHLHAQENMNISTNGFLIGGQFLCRKYFCELSKVSPYIINEVFSAFSAGQKFFVHGNVVGLRQSPATIGFICWLKDFAINYGNFAADEQVIVISACFTVKEMYMMYNIQAPEPQVKMSSFYSLFRSHFGPRREDPSLPCVRISSYSSHSKCDQCILLERHQRSCQSEEDLAVAKGLKQEHKQVYVRARVAIEEKRMKAINDPKNHIFIQVDDMDNHKVRKNHYFEN